MTIAPSRCLLVLCRLSWLSYSAGLLTTMICLGADSRVITFDLPGDVMEKSVKRFAAQSGAEVLMESEEFAAVRTQAVRGRMTSRQALDAMLSGTGLMVFQDSKTGAFALRKDRSSSQGQANGEKPSGDRITSKKKLVTSLHLEKP